MQPQDKDRTEAQEISPGVARAFLAALERRRAHQVLTCISCGAKTKPGEAPPCGH